MDVVGLTCTQFKHPAVTHFASRSFTFVGREREFIKAFPDLKHQPGTKYQSCPVKWNVWEDSTEKLTNTHTETKSCEPDAGTGDKEITNTTKQKIKNYK